MSAVPSSALPPANQRNAELALLGFASLIVVSALFIVEASRERPITLDLLKLGAAFLALYTIAHIAVRKIVPYADPLILPTVALLNGLGLVMIHRIDLAAMETALAYGRTAPNPEATRQVLWTAVGVMGFITILFLVRDHRVLARFGYTLGLAGLVFLAIPMVLPASMSEVNGAKIWIILPGFSIQPGEFSKILLLIFIAALLVAKRDIFTIAGRRIGRLDLPRLRDAEIGRAHV